MVGLTVKFDLTRARYLRLIPAGRASVAVSLLTFWDRPWSSNAKRFAAHALAPAYARGIDVLGG